MWAGSAAALFALSVLWALATPIGAAPDEPVQVIRAASVARGEIVGHQAAGQPPAVTTVTVPSSFAQLIGIPACFAFRPTVPAGCAPGLSGSSRPTAASTYVGRYPPLYYMLVGAPSLLWSSGAAVYAMRILGALWCALLVGLAFAVAATWSRSRLLVASLAVAVTPQVVFLSSVVNPSGLEIAAAIATWTCGLVLVVDHRRAPPAGLVAATACSASVLALCRDLSLLWLAGIAAVLLAVAPGATALLRSRAIRRGALVVLAVGAGAGAYVLAAQALSVLPVGQPVAAHASVLAVVAEVLGRTGQYLRESVGVFGWLDTPSPLAVLVGWWTATGMVVAMATVSANRRAVGTLAGVLAAAVAVPTAMIAAHAHADGLVWQGRDGLPLYVGVPLVAGAIAGRSSADPDVARVGGLAGRLALRLGTLVVVGVAAAQLVDFVWALRRYTVGLGATLDPFAHVAGGWRPPLTAPGLVALAVVAAVAYGRWVLGLQRSAAGRPDRPARSGEAGASGSLVADLLLTTLAADGTGRVATALTHQATGPAPATRPDHPDAPALR